VLREIIRNRDFTAFADSVGNIGEKQFSRSFVLFSTSVRFKVGFQVRFQFLLLRDLSLQSLTNGSDAVCERLCRRKLRKMMVECCGKRREVSLVQWLFFRETLSLRQRGHVLLIYLLARAFGL